MAAFTLRPATQQAQRVARVLLLTLFLNLLVAGAKLAVGLAVGALSMVADAVHSFLDSASNVAGLVGVTLASQPPDAEHPYGHRKFEIFAAMAISVLMGATCVEILERAWGSLQDPDHGPNPTPLAFAVMVATMAVNAGVSWYEGHKGRELQSRVLAADSAHTRSDVLASATVLAALAAAEAGWVWVDLAASVLVVGIILRVAYDIVQQSLDVLADHIMLDPGRVASAALGVRGVVSCHKVRSRGMPGHVFVDLHVQVPPTYSVNQSHAVTHAVMAEVKRRIEGVEEVYVHTEPATPEDYESVGKRPPPVARKAARKYRRRAK